MKGIDPHTGKVKGGGARGNLGDVVDEDEPPRRREPARKPELDE